MLVLAFAGTGKTSVLVEYAKIRENKNFLYTAFNRQIIYDSNGKFSKNVESKTLHKIAYDDIGVYYKHKIKKTLSINEIIKILRLDKNVSSYKIARKIKEILEGYFFSDIKSLSKYINTINIEKNIYKIVKKLTEIVWSKMGDSQNNYSITIDALFKIFCNKDPELSYDYIMLDEAQDSNGVSKELIISQLKKGKKIIFVGDNYQSIYKFRNSKNILKEVISTEVFYLTKSFRFGKSIAKKANKILELFNEQKKIIGNEKINDNVGEIDFNNKYTIINRTNSGVLTNAVKYINSDKKIFFIGGIESYNFEKIKDIENLFNKNFSEIKDKNILNFFSFEDFLEDAIEKKEKENFLYAKLIINFKGNLIRKLEELKKIETKNYEEANIVFTTAHKSKGLEFDQVIVGNDFIKFEKINKQSIFCDKIIEEVNLLYVALTRAKKNLIIK